MLYIYDTLQQHAIASIPPVHAHERRAFMQLRTRPQERRNTNDTAANGSKHTPRTCIRVPCINIASTYQITGLLYHTQQSFLHHTSNNAFKPTAISYKELSLVYV